MVELSRIKNFSLLHTVGYKRQHWDAAGIIHPALCSGSSWLCSFPAQGAVSGSQAFKAAPAQALPLLLVTISFVTLSQAAAQALLRTFPGTPKAAGKPQLIDRPKMKPGQGKTCKS